MVDKDSRIAIIPARGGSKRIPRKNIIDFHGKPMIAWTIAAALGSGAFDRVIVSTDDEEIASVSRTYGAEVPFLRRDHADDHATVSDVIVATLKRLGAVEGTVAMLMANCPLRGATDIRAQVAEFDRTGASFQLSAFAYGFANPWWAHEVNPDGAARPRFPEALKSRSQDLPELLCPTGACWLARIPALLAAETFYGPDYHFAELDRIAATDIDDYADLAFAKALYVSRRHEGEQ